MPRSSIQEPTFLILTALAAGPQHGYGIMTDVAEISGDRVKLRAGTLERRYRRLLACYPAAYRTEYGEEMIGVLLASSRADQGRRAVLARTGTRLAVAWPQGASAPDRHGGRASGRGRALPGSTS